jgi:hypothetical protein
VRGQANVGRCLEKILRDVFKCNHYSVLLAAPPISSHQIQPFLSISMAFLFSHGVDTIIP